MKDKVIIFGTSGHAKVSIDILELQNYRIAGLVSGDKKEKGRRVMGFPILGHDDDPEIAKLLKDKKTKYFVAIGDNAIRKKVTDAIVKKFKKQPVNAIHPSAVVSRYADLGYGNFINCGAKINAGVNIGNGVIINTSASVDHDVSLSDYSQISPGVNLAGGVEVAHGAFIGTGAVVIPKVKIGKGSVVGAGAVVIRDIPPGVVAVGSPARVIKNLS